MSEVALIALQKRKKKLDQNWFGNKNLAKNYQIWTLLFLPFLIFKSLALSTELLGGLLKNFPGN